MSNLELITFLAQCALEDQHGWLKLFGHKHMKVSLEENDLKFIEEKRLANGKTLKIFFGVIHTDVDDHNQKHNTPFVLKTAGDLAAKIFNSRMSLDCSIELDSKRSERADITLIGYWGVLKKSEKKYEVIYAAARSDADLKNELYQTVLSADV